MIILVLPAARAEVGRSGKNNPSAAANECVAFIVVLVNRSFDTRDPGQVQQGDSARESRLGTWPMMQMVRRDRKLRVVRRVALERTIGSQPLPAPIGSRGERGA